MDLGYDFFLIKFNNEQNSLQALHDGPWFVYNNFISVQKREPNLVASQAHLAHTAIWVRLPELPTEFYDFEILRKIGGKQEPVKDRYVHIYYVSRLIRSSLYTNAARKTPAAPPLFGDP